MIYEFVDDETGDVIEREFDPTHEVPTTVAEKGRTYRRKWGDVATHIPEDWGESDIDFSKRPSRRKQYY